MSAVMKHMPPRASGNTMAEMQETLTWIGLVCQGRQANTAEIVAETPPFIAHFPNHFVVARRIDARNVCIVDGFGRRGVLTLDEFGKLWDGKYLRITPPDADTLLPSFVSPVAPGQPRLRFRTLSLDCGEVENPDVGGSVAFEFELRNVGKGMLNIAKIRTDCGCAVAEQPATNLDPGSTAKITIKYIAANSRGPFQHSAFVQTNDPVFPLIRLSLSGSSSQTLELLPPVFDLRASAADARAKGRMLIRYRGDRPFRITGLETQDRVLRARVVPLSIDLAKESLPDVGAVAKTPDPNAYELSAEINLADLALTKAEGKIDVLTTLAKFPRVSVPYKITVAPDAAATPSLAFLGDIAPGGSAGAEVSMSLTDHEAFRILSVQAPSGLQCDYPGAAASVVPLRFSLLPGLSTARMDSAAVVEYVRNGDSVPRTFSVPVYGYAIAGGHSERAL
jgi:hypothetical protein